MVKLIYAANAIAKACRLGGSGEEMIYPVPNEVVVELEFPRDLPSDLIEPVAPVRARFNVTCADIVSRSAFGLSPRPARAATIRSWSKILSSRRTSLRC